MHLYGRKILTLLLIGVFLLVISFPLTGLAGVKTESSLTNQEIEKLKNDVGLTADEIDNMPKEILRQLVIENAKKLAGGSEVFTVYENADQSDEIQPMSLVQGSDIKIAGKAFSVTSDLSGYKKYIYTVTSNG